MASNKEIRLQQAINDYQTRRYPSIRAAAAAYDVNYATLSRRLRGGLSVAQSREPQQFLSNRQEEMLKRWIIDLEAQGHPPTFSAVRELAVVVSKATGGPESIGQNWTDRFLHRHPKVHSKIGKKIHVLRLKTTTPEALEGWFGYVKTVRERYNIQCDNTYNMDETGIVLGVCNNQQIIGSSTSTTAYKKTPENREWVSIIETISATGRRLKALVIFKG